MKPAPRRGSLATALWMVRSGLWPIPVTRWGKTPLGRAWGVTYPTREKLLDTFRRHKGAGVGLALGPAAGLVDFEIDDKAAAEKLLDRVELPETFGWSSARGEHRVFFWDKRLDGLPTVIHLDGAELRIGQDGKQLFSVCPPSVGDDRRCRRWSGCWVVCPFPESLLWELDRRKVRDPQHKSDHRPFPRTGVGGNRYAEAALRNEVRNVAGAKEGTRNAKLNKAAFSLGGLVAVGLLAREAVENALLEAALVAGLGEAESAATIQSGLNAGVQKPRRL